MSKVETRQKQKEKALLKKKDAPVESPELITKTVPVDQSLIKDEDKDKVYEGSFFGIPTGYKYTGKEIDDAIYGQFTGESRSDATALQDAYGSPSPAVIEETVTYSEPTLGVRSVVDVVPRIDVSKLTQIPGLGVENTFGKDDKGNVSESAKQAVMKAIGFKNKSGLPVTFDDSDTYEDRIRMMNKGAATTIVAPVGENASTDIPLNYAKLLAEKIDIGPTGEGEGFFKGFAGESKIPSPVFNIPFTELNQEGKALSVVERRRKARKGEKFTRSGTYQYILDTGFDKELTKAIYARDLNKYLIKIGVDDARTRLGIINFETSLPNILSVGFGDVEKVSARFAENLKFFLEAGGYLVGETLGSFIEAVGGPVDFDDSESREQFFSKIAPTMSRIIQRKLAQNNIRVPYRVAEQLARRYSGIGSGTIAVVPDIVLPSAAVKGVLKGRAKSKIKKYQDFSANRKKEDSTLSDDQILTEFQTKENQTIFGINVYDNAQVQALPLVKKFATKVAGKTILPIRRTFNGGALTNGLQLEEAAKIAETAIKNKRVYGPPNLQPIYKLPEVSVMLANRKRSIDEAISIEKKINLDPTSKAVPELRKRLQTLELQDAKNVKDIMGVVAKANEPRFLREITKVDNYMILGAGAVSQMAQELGGDPVLFEFVGMMTGLVVGGFDNLSEAARFVLRSTPVLGTQQNLKQFAKLINTFSPELQDMIYARAAKFMQVQDELIAAGVPIEQVQTPLNAIMGLNVLHLAEESGRHLIKESSLRNPKLVAELTQNLENQKLLVTKLREAMAVMDGKNLSGGSQRFFNMIKTATDYSEANIAQLTNDINIIEKNGAKYYKGILNGDANNNLSVIEVDDIPSVATKMDEALNNLANRGIKNYSADDIAGIETQRKINQQELRDDIKTKAVDLITKGNVNRLKSVDEAAIDVTYAVDTQKVGRKGDIQVTNTTGLLNDGVQEASDLFAILLEAKHLDEIARFNSLYGRLNGTLINPTTGAAITGKVSSDGGIILDKMFDVLRRTEEVADDSSLLLIERLNNSTINKGQESKIFEIIENNADRYFQSKALQQNKTLSKYKDELVAAMEDAVEKDQHILLKGVSQNINLLNYVRSTGMKIGKNPQIIPFSVNEVRQLRTAFGQLANKSKNTSAKRKLNELDRATDDTFKSGFTVETGDGSKLRLNTLGLKAINPRTNAEETMTVLDYLKAVDGEYFNFKRRFYDKGPIADRMGFNSKRLYVEPSLINNVAIGLDTTIPTNRWLDLDEIVKLKTDVEVKNYGDKIMSALGSREGNSFILKPGTDEADTFKSVLEAAYSQWLLRNAYKSTPREIIQQSEKIANAFNFVDESGKSMQVLDWKNIVDEGMSFNSTNFAEETLNKADDIVEQAIQNIIDTTVAKAKKVKENAEKVRDVLRNYSVDRVDDAQLADQLLGGGQARLNNVTDALKKAGMKDNDITEAIYEVIGEAIDDKTFRRTGTYSMDFKNSKIYPDLDMDIDALKKFAGFENPKGARATVFNEIVGEKRAKFYRSMIEFLELQKMEGQTIYGLKNAARAFSLESYISRFYSIQRGVISARYVGTEAILQQYRLRGASAFRAMLNDPQAGQAFLDMIRSGKQLDPKANRSLFNLLVKFYAANKDILENMEQQNIHGNVLNIPTYLLKNLRQLQTQAPVLATDEFGDFRFPEFLEVPPEKESDAIKTQMLNIQRQKQRRRGLPNEAVQ